MLPGEQQELWLLHLEWTILLGLPLIISLFLTLQDCISVSYFTARDSSGSNVDIPWLLTILCCTLTCSPKNPNDMCRNGCLLLEYIACGHQLWAAFVTPPGLLLTSPGSVIVF
jgi:hypothetical protein